MRLDFDILSVSPQSSLQEVVRAIDRGRQGAAFIVGSEQSLVRVVTDGDVRRALLDGASLTDSVGVLRPAKPVTSIGDPGPHAARRIMLTSELRHLPVTEIGGRLCGYYWLPDLIGPIFLSAPHMGDLEEDLVAEAFETNWIAPAGPHLAAFEADVAHVTGTKGAVALTSGTAALHLGLRLLGVGPGDLVFCSTLTFAASAQPILYERAVPVFIDSEPRTWNMSPDALRREMDRSARNGQKPAAVIVVHLYGQPADMTSIRKICDEYGVPILEDAAEAMGSTYGNTPCGSLGDLGVFSFNGNKIITTSGGGMLLGNSTDALERARYLATQGRDNTLHYQHSEIAYNYRLSNVLAGIGRGQLQVLASRVQRKREIFEHYRRAFADIEGVKWQEEVPGTASNRWLSACTLEVTTTNLHPFTIIRQLAAQQIEARPVWKPMHLQPLFRGNRYVPHSEDESVSDRLFLTGICLPSGTRMTDEQVDYVIQQFKESLHG